MKLHVGQWDYQEAIDTELLKEELGIENAHLHLFIETIFNEYDKVTMWEDEDGDTRLVVSISRSTYDESEDKHELVKERVESALEEMHATA